MTELERERRPTRFSARPPPRFATGTDFSLWIKRVELYIQEAGLPEEKKGAELVSLLEGLEVARNQFIQGILSSTIQLKLLTDSPETLDDAVKLAYRLQTAELAQEHLKAEATIDDTRGGGSSCAIGRSDGQVHKLSQQVERLTEQLTKLRAEREPGKRNWPKKKLTCWHCDDLHVARPDEELPVEEENGDIDGDIPAEASETDDEINSNIDREIPAETSESDDEIETEEPPVDQGDHLQGAEDVTHDEDVQMPPANLRRSTRHSQRPD
ncbi:hypothetical protein EMCRGX_G001039 [Ephydatia muelleri]